MPGPRFRTLLSPLCLCDVAPASPVRIRDAAVRERTHEPPAKGRALAVLEERSFSYAVQAGTVN
jgi:hypothetical protein